jgi:hypothetical protein
MRHRQSPLRLWTNVFSVSSLDHTIPAVALKQGIKSLTRSILVGLVGAFNCVLLILADLITLSIFG